MRDVYLANCHDTVSLSSVPPLNLNLGKARCWAQRRVSNVAMWPCVHPDHAWPSSVEHPFFTPQPRFPVSLAAMAVADGLHCLRRLEQVARQLALSWPLLMDQTACSAFDSSAGPCCCLQFRDRYTQAGAWL